ncbi:MCP four helix bundle domain-containing protein [Burkholderia sp. Ac-20353]|uniref:MCP four helix bundle domain-containing protein n=1 Tax=Burkholderia sp. Ac-20353 TaxID=2703894 RepID=UPI00197C7EA8|nr:MCP four helix bundle domain-containing protein [Burkholderia sp. Ac-20353]MBN3785750.1 hypothetical protein [Burkholderia sp. Ac-20353]
MSTTQAPAGAGVVLPQADIVRVPGRLRIRGTIIVVLSLLVAVIGWCTYRSYASVVQTIGKDSEPSIVAAENIRSTLGNAHAALVNVFLTGEGADGASAREYRKSLTQANDYLVAAAQNITYGDEERRPILDILNQLSDYQSLVGMALAQGGNVQVLHKADDLMREHIAPAADALAQANFRHLDAAYTDGRSAAHRWLAVFGAASLVLLVVLLDTQRYVYASFRRLVNPAMAAGSLLFVLAVALFAYKAGHVMSGMRTAKEDAFDSVYALSQAQAVAYAANAQESVYLITPQKDAQGRQTALFRDDANKLFSANIANVPQLPPDLKRLQGHGLLGNELANITFDGEDAAAKAALAGWLEYVRIDEQIRALEAAGRHNDAVALCVGTRPGESDWAFDRFVKALLVTMNINQTQFDLAVARAFDDVRWLWILLVAVLLCPLAGALAGLQQRLAEFRE